MPRSISQRSGTYATFFWPYCCHFLPLRLLQLTNHQSYTSPCSTACNWYSRPNRVKRTFNVRGCVSCYVSFIRQRTNPASNTTSANISAVKNRNLLEATNCRSRRLIQGDWAKRLYLGRSLLRVQIRDLISCKCVERPGILIVINFCRCRDKRAHRIIRIC